MSIPVDSTLEHPKYAASAPTGNPAANNVFGPIYRGPDSVNYWRDENGNEFADQWIVKAFADSKTLGIGDRKTLQNYTGTAAATLTIPTNATIEFSIGATIQIMRGVGSGALTLATASGVTIAASNGFLDNTLYPGEIVEIQKVGTDAWIGRVLNDKQIRIIPYTYRTKSTWVATGLASSSSIAITPAIQTGTISVGLQTEHSGGVFALTGAAGSTVSVSETHGYYANAVRLRRSINHATAPAFSLSVDDGGILRLVFGLLHTSATDGAAIAANNLFISFVYETTGGILMSTTISGDIEFELLFAVAGDDIPLPI
jgi:hypothetical protein